MVKSKEKDRRCWPRAKRVISLEYRLFKSHHQEPENSWHLSTTDNVCAQGLAFYTEKEYSIGDILELNITMSGVLNIFNGRGVIIRIDQKISGSCFLIAVQFIGQTIYPQGQNTNTKRSPRKPQ